MEQGEKTKVFHGICDECGAEGYSTQGYPRKRPNICPKCVEGIKRQAFSDASSDEMSWEEIDNGLW